MLWFSAVWKGLEGENDEDEEDDEDEDEEDDEPGLEYLDKEHLSVSSF